MDGAVQDGVAWPPGMGDDWPGMNEDEEEEEWMGEEEEWTPQRKPECPHCAPLIDPGRYPDRQGTPFKRMVLNTPQGQLTLRDITVLPKPPKVVKAPEAVPKRKKPPQVDLARISKVSLKSGPQWWSGWVYLNEIEDRQRERRYKRQLEKSLRERKLWKIFNRKKEKHYVTLRTASSGPEWFQDLSFAQMEAVDGLEEALMWDKEQVGGAGPLHTQVQLYKLGVTPPLGPKSLSVCARKARSDTIMFLVLVHRAIVKREQKEYEQKFHSAKKVGSIISPFSLNERLVLSGIFHAHFQHFINKLDKMLPKPPPRPEVLLGALPKKEKKTYPSPYLEPQPMNKKCWYEQRAEEVVYKAIRKKVRRKEARLRREKNQRQLDVFFRKEQQEMIARLREEAEEKVRQKELEALKAARIKLVLEPPPSIQLDEGIYLGEEEDVGEEGEEEEEEEEMEEMEGVYYEELMEEELVEEEEGEEEEEEVEPCDVVAEWAEFAEDRGAAETTFVIRTAPEELLAVVMCHVSTQTKSPAGGFYLEDFVLKANLEESTSVRPSDSLYELREFEPFTLIMAPELVPTSLRSFGMQTRMIRDFEPLDLMRLFEPELVVPPESSEQQDRPGPEQIGAVKEEQGTGRKKEKEKEETKENKGKKETKGKKEKKEKKETKEKKEKKGKKETKEKEETKEKKGKNEKKIKKTPSEEGFFKLPIKIKRPAKTLEQAESELNRKPINVECTDENCQLLRDDEVPMDAFELARRQIAVLPEDQQLEAAVKYLCDQGDPLAILPSIEKVPWLVRWFEKRRGVKVKLTEKDKEELMERSRKMWDAPMPMPSSVPLPELPLSQEAADKLTYDDLESTRKIVKKNVGKFFSEVKQLMVGNSRNMYPSMFNEYFDTPLNKSFRTTFFTYMPSREVEAIVYRLWKPEEKKEEQAEEEEEGEDEEQAETKH